MNLHCKGVMVLVFPPVLIPFRTQISSFVVKHEGQVGDGIALGEEVLLVEGLHLVERAEFPGGEAVPEGFGSGCIEVRRTGQHLQIVAAGNGIGVLVKIAAVRLEIDYAALCDEAAVTLEEERGGEALFLPAYLRVGEGQPDLGDLSRREERGDEFNAGAQETHVGHCGLRGFAGPGPQSCALDVNSYVIY